MNLVSVAKRDLTSISRSRAVWAAGVVLTLFVALVAYTIRGYQLSATESVTNIFQTLAFTLGLILPIVALLASYLAIAGERRSGGIKFLLSVPNTRRDVFVGKLASRLTLLGVGLGVAFLTAASIALTRFGAFPLGTIGGLFVVSLVYGAAFVCVGVALSAAFATRSRAIAGAFGLYFVLVMSFVAIRITDLLRMVHENVLGFEATPNLYDGLTHLSPYIAYQKATNLVFPPDQQTVVFRRAAEANAELPVYLTDEFSLVVLALWVAVPLALGYRRFDRADLE
ncbi:MULTISPECIES: ABC transporter permease [unclassified Haladaptatus]|uniref:ABC transporter permease n=1 Tax=unclassified Haladaptatus TaxID=2622732 RepID=UPI0023E76E40|nr:MULTISPECIES: ABC transporter permease subunit [unclassified Haladaptatus]